MTSPELSADPICDRSLVNDVLVLLLVLLVLLVMLDESVDVVLEESNRLVSESYAVCAPLTSPVLMALNRLSTSCPSVLIPESLLVDESVDVELASVVLGVV